MRGSKLCSTLSGPDGLQMPVELWRDDTQPGNILDKRDEQCTAQSRPGRQPEFLGLDDYECNGTQLHITICHIELPGMP